MPGVPGGQPAGRPRGGDTTAVVPPREAWGGGAGRGEPWGGRVVQSPAAKRKAMIDNAIGTVRTGAGRAWGGADAKSRCRSPMTS